MKAKKASAAKKPTTEELCRRIEEHMKDPEYVRGMYEFILKTT